MLLINYTAIPEQCSTLCPQTYAITPAKTRAQLHHCNLLVCSKHLSLCNRISIIEPPRSRAQDSKIVLGDAGSPKVLHTHPLASVKHHSLRIRNPTIEPRFTSDSSTSAVHIIRAHATEAHAAVRAAQDVPPHVVFAVLTLTGTRATIDGTTVT
jgi:hypothetical protein